MFFPKTILSLVLMLAAQSTSILAYSKPNGTAPCPSAANIPIGYVRTYSAYACRGDLETFSNVTSGICIDAKNFTTVRGYRTGNPPEGVECSFNFYAAPGCKGSFVSAGKDTDGSNNWVECVRNFVNPYGDVVETGSSFMYACYSRLDGGG